MPLNRSILSAAAMALALTVSVAAYGQQPQAPSSMPNARTQQQSTVDDKDIQAFANATTDVQRVQRKWIPTIAKQPGQAGQQKAQQQAMTEMADAVQKNGLSVDKYNQIVQIAQANPEIQRKIEDRLRQNGALDEEQDNQLDEREQ